MDQLSEAVSNLRTYEDEKRSYHGMFSSNNYEYLSNLKILIFLGVPSSSGS